MMRVGDPIETTAANLHGLLKWRVDNFVVRAAGVVVAVALYRAARRCDILRTRVKRCLLFAATKGRNAHR